MSETATEATIPQTSTKTKISMDSLTKNLAELGTKLQTGAAEFAEKHELEKKVQPLKQKAEALTAKAGEAIAGATNKFTAMVEARKKKRQEESEAAAAAAAAGGETDNSESGQSPQKKLLVTAETAVKKAFENAEKIARKVAKKAGIFDDGKETTVPKTDEEEVAASSSPSPAVAEEPETTPAAQPETTPAADSAEPNA